MYSMYIVCVCGGGGGAYVRTYVRTHACVGGGACVYVYTCQWRIRGGVQGVRTPPFGPRCRLFNIGPKVGPPFLLVDLRWTPVADPGCVCDRGDITDHPAPPWNVDDVTRATVGVFFNFSEGG